MNKNNIIKYFGLCLIILASVDFPISDNGQHTHVALNAGINGPQIQKGVKSGWKWLKSCVGHKEEVKYIKNDVLNKKLKSTKLTDRLSYTTGILEKGIGEIKAQDEILPKIEEYFSQTKPYEEGNKVINCVKTERDNVRMLLFEEGKSRATTDKIIKVATETKNIAEYDIRALSESSYKGNDGIEYVEFIIPKKAQYVLNAQYSDRLYECMVFNVPKDIQGNWKRFKEYLIAFLNDLVNRPFQLWNEYQFRRGLAEIDIDSRDVTEMERYLFAQIINSIQKNEAKKYIQKNIA